MVRRYINSLEKPSHRRARFRRGFAFGFFAISFLFALVGWILGILTGHILLWEPQTLGSFLLPLGIATALYAGAIILGEMEVGYKIERTWLAIMSVLFVGFGFWLVFIGTLFFLDSIVSR